MFWWGHFMRNERSKITSDLLVEVKAGVDCMHYVMNSNWWEWKMGSRLLFWRWPFTFRVMARDGIPVCWLSNKRPKNKTLQPKIEDEDVKNQMKEKIEAVRRKGYIKKGHVESLIRFFPVPKGDQDIRMVYDGTDSGFNSLVWVQSFGLPTIQTLLRGTSPTTWMVDLDIAEQFLNFCLHSEASKYVGVDLTTLCDITEDSKLGSKPKIVWERYTRCAMGLKLSPNHAIRATLRAEEFITDFPWSSKNPFRYSRVVLNLPGSPDYTPGQPWFYLERKDGTMASILAIYVDDQRIHAPTEEDAYVSARQVASREAYLGIQDAARKRRAPSQQAGAWAGSIVRTNNSEVGLLISNKTKIIISKWCEILESTESPDLVTKELFSDRGFLVYICRTYDILTPYLKGLHLTIDGWRFDRDGEGWKDTEFHKFIKAGTFNNKYSHKNVNMSYDYPKTVKPVTRLKSDMKALKKLTEMESPPVLLIHTDKIFVARYIFGDASGRGFGVTSSEGDTLSVEFGTWVEEAADLSSNFRELNNFVLKLEREAERGNLNGAELFLFTDNSTAEAAFNNGTSSSKLLFELVLRMKVVQMNHSIRIHVIHVPGTRMIAQGADGLSRGNLSEGVMTGLDILRFIPINKSVIQRSPSIVNWFKHWTESSTLKILSPRDWLWAGQGLSNVPWKNCDGMEMPQESSDDTLLWCPPPCIADIALEYLRKSIVKRPDMYHIFCCTKLMTYKWRKHLIKNCDFYFYIDAGHSFWDDSQFESILIAIFSPTLHCAPWSIKRSQKLLAVEGKLCKLQKDKNGSEGPLLRKFWNLLRTLPCMHERMVRDVLSSREI